MTPWLNWSDFLSANQPQVQAEQEAAQAQAEKDRTQMDALLRQVNAQAQSDAKAGWYKGAQSGNSAQAYNELMAAQKEAAARAPAASISQWDAELRGDAPQAESPWGQLGARLGGINAKAAQTQSDTMRKRREDEAARQAAEWNKKQRELWTQQHQGARDAEAKQYAEWSDYVQGHSNGGVGAGAYYDAAAGKGPQPVTIPQSEREKQSQQIYRTAGGYYNSDSNWGSPNNRGSIFTGNWSF